MQITSDKKLTGTYFHLHFYHHVIPLTSSVFHFNFSVTEMLISLTEPPKRIIRVVCLSVSQYAGSQSTNTPRIRANNHALGCHLTGDITTKLCHPVPFNPHSRSATMRSQRRPSVGSIKGKFLLHSLTHSLDFPMPQCWMFFSASFLQLKHMARDKTSHKVIYLAIHLFRPFNGLS